MQNVTTHFEIAIGELQEALKLKKITKKQFSILVESTYSEFTKLAKKGDKHKKEKQIWLPAFELGCSTQYLEELDLALAKIRGFLANTILRNDIRKSRFTLEDYNRSLRAVLAGSF